MYLLEAHTKIVELKESSPGIFAFVFEWLYIQDSKQIGDIKKLDGAEACKPSAVTYTDIWKLADYLDMPKLCNFVITRLFNAFDTKTGDMYIMTGLVKPCYKGTVPETSLRYWIATLFALGVGIHDIDMEPAELDKLICHHFLFDSFRYRGILAKAITTGTVTVDPEKWPDCGSVFFSAEEFFVGAPKLTLELIMSNDETSEGLRNTSSH